MKHRTMLQMSILVALGLGVLFSLVAFDQPGRQDTELLEVSVIIREADSTGWSAARQGMEQAAADLGAELRFLTLSQSNSAEEQRSLLAREVDRGKSSRMGTLAGSPYTVAEEENTKFRTPWARMAFSTVRVFTRLLV